MHHHCLMSTVPTSTALPSRTKLDRATYDSPLHTKCAKEHTTIALVLQFAPNLQYKYKYLLSACHLVGT